LFTFLVDIIEPKLDEKAVGAARAVLVDGSTVRFADAARKTGLTLPDIHSAVRGLRRTLEEVIEDLRLQDRKAWRRHCRALAEPTNADPSAVADMLVLAAGTPSLPLSEHFVLSY
jgi:hypothetical protein